MRSYIVGTAGHIDHGKTALVKALTGVDTDRLKEEKRRGITIELGFAHLVADEVVFGIVDVPGHERFIKSMVAGAGGIDLVILVIAADEGVMPQTREHLDICRLLGVRRGLVALTKTDLVDPEWLALVEEDLRASVLEGTFLEGAELVRCSAVDGSGIERLRQCLLALADELPPRGTDGVLRLPLDRVFTIKGFGTVVTGSLLSGRVERGDEVEILPSDLTAAVRRIQVHGDEVQQAVAGQRTAINLGGLDRQAVARGEVLAQAGTLAASPMVDVELSLLETANRSLGGRAKVLFHLGTRQQEATCVLLEPRRVAPGETALAQLRFDRPVVALPGDRFILRGFVKQDNHGTTIGGGEVLRVLAPKLLARDREGVALLAEVAAARGDRPQRAALEVLGAGQRGLRRAELQQRLALAPRALDRVLEGLLNQRQLVRWDRSSGAVVHRRVFDRLRTRALAIVDRFHDDNPVKPGIGRAELASRLGDGVDPRLAVALVDRLQREGELEVKGEHCLRPGHHARVSAELGPLTGTIAARYVAAALAPPRQAELEASLEAPADTVRAALKALTTDGILVRVGPLLFHREPLAELGGRLRAHLEQRGEITPGEFKTLVGQSRKFSIPLAEHFDAQGLTRRVGDVRRLRG